MRTTLPRTILNFIALGAFSTLQAQTGVLTSDELMSPGTVFHMSQIGDLTVIDTTIQGAGSIWDFTDLQATGPSYLNEVLVPASAPHISSFPAANFVLYEEVVDRHSYFTVTSDHMERIGVYRNVLITYSDPQREYEYPLTLGSSHFDDWANDNVSFPGTIAVECIGSGTLQLPGHTFTDVLLVRQNFVNLLPFSSYQWIDANNGMTLVNFLPTSLFGPEIGYYTTSFAIGIDEVSSSFDLRMSTLVNEWLNITYTSDGPLHYSIMDPAGRILKEGIVAAAFDPSTEHLDVSAFAAGVHLFTLHDRATGSKKTLRFVKQ